MHLNTAVLKPLLLAPLILHAVLMSTCRRQSEAEAKAREVRLMRALEEIERYKALVHEQRTADRDVKDGAKAEHARLLTGGLCCALSPGPSKSVASGVEQ